MTDPTPERPIIWAISSGDYSDFTVHAVYELKEDAEAVLAQLATLPHSGGYDYDLISFSFFPAGDRSFKARLMVHGYITVSEEGVIGEFERRLVSQVGTEDTRRATGPHMWHSARSGIYQISASGPDPEAVAKAASEKAAEVAALIAEGHDPMEIEQDRIAHQNPIKDMS